MKTEKISLPNACAEKWERMEGCSGGRFCSICATKVVDFTGKGTLEIADYLERKRGEKVCGRFNLFQLDGRDSLYNRALNSVYKVENRFFKVVLTTFVGSLVFLVACGKKVGEPFVLEKDTTKVKQDTSQTK